MDSTQFNKLKYGNVIQAGGFSGVPIERLLVLHVKKDVSGNVTEVGVVPSIPVSDSQRFEVVDWTAEETLLDKNNILQSVTLLP